MGGVPFHDRGDFCELRRDAQLLLYTLDRLVCHEGRFLSDARVIRLRGSLLDLTPDEISAAVVELEAARFVQRYSRGQFLFLVDHFSSAWCGRRRYWRRSEYPLPDLAVLQRYPEYLAGLRRLNRNGQARFNGELDLAKDSKRGPRYLELWPELTNGPDTRTSGLISDDSAGEGRSCGDSAGIAMTRDDSMLCSALLSPPSPLASESGGGVSLLRLQEKELQSPFGPRGRPPPPLLRSMFPRFRFN